MSLEASNTWCFMLPSDNSVSDYDMTTWANLGGEPPILGLQSGRKVNHRYYGSVHLL